MKIHKKILFAVLGIIFAFAAPPTYAYNLDLETDNALFESLQGTDGSNSYGSINSVGDINADGYDEYAISVYLEGTTGSLFSVLNTSKNKKNGKKARIRLTRKGNVVKAHKYKLQRS